MSLHQSVFRKLNLFTKVGNKYYITWISSQLSPQVQIPGQHIYREGDDIDNFYFMTKGLAAFILPL